MIGSFMRFSLTGKEHAGQQQDQPNPDQTKGNVSKATFKRKSLIELLPMYFFFKK
jgi:hypothetical protein